MIGSVLAIIILLVAAVIIYNILVLKISPQQSLKLFVDSNWSTRFSEFGIVTDAFLEKTGLKI